MVFDLGSHQDISRFNIAMNDVSFLGVLQCQSNVIDDAQRVAGRKLASFFDNILTDWKG